MSTKQPGAGRTVAVPERNGAAHARLGTWGAGLRPYLALCFAVRDAVG